MICLAMMPWQRPDGIEDQRFSSRCLGDSILKIGQNMKYDTKIFKRVGITVDPIDDTMLMCSECGPQPSQHGCAVRTISCHTPIRMCLCWVLEICHHV
jgi:DNA polymerase I-like protein with 3'-5' exonuclease and polymerase domains